MYKNYKKNSFYKNSKVFLLLIVISTFFLGIGYAKISSIELSVSGTATAKAQTGIIITDVTYSSNNNADTTNSVINTFYQCMLDSTIVLNNHSDSSITYQISIKNLESYSQSFLDTVYAPEFYDNEDIIYELNGLSPGDIIAPGETKNFTITFKYKEVKADYPNTVLSSYINFRFKRDNAATISFNVNGGTPNPSDITLDIGSPIGELPTATKELCDNTTGTTPEERGCTYIGSLVGWYLEPSFQTKVESDYIVNQDTILYAKWHSEYEAYTHLESIEFDGVDDYLDTGVNLFSEDNLNKDFDLSYDIDYIDENHVRTSGIQQISIMNSKDESISTYPGFVMRFNTGNPTKMIINSRWGNNSKAVEFLSSNIPIHVYIKRRNGVVTVSGTWEGGSLDETTIFNQANWKLTSYAPKNVVFGSAYDANGNPFRFFKGILSNISIKAY